jgi:hypothetical protein
MKTLLTSLIEWYRSFINPTFEDEVRDWAIKSHRKVRHRYDKKPYSFHLKMVHDFGKKYSYLLPKEKVSVVLLACWCHDLIEDARKTYNDVKEFCGIIIAEITYALTNDKGKNRAERAGAKYYEGIRQVEFADYVKICDRLANIKYSTSKKSKMMNAYAKEHPKFKAELYSERWKPMFDEMEEMLGIKK